MRGMWYGTPEAPGAIGVFPQEHFRAELDAIRLEPLHQSEIIEERKDLLHVNRTALVMVTPIKGLLQLPFSLFGDANRFLIVLRAAGGG